MGKLMNATSPDSSKQNCQDEAKINIAERCHHDATNTSVATAIGLQDGQSITRIALSRAGRREVLNFPHQLMSEVIEGSPLTQPEG